MINLLMTLADATTEPAGGNGGGAAAPSSGLDFFGSILPFLLIIGVFLFIMSRGRAKEQKRYEQMLSSLKRNDRVQTVGGVIGTIVDVRDNEVVLKVDETTNTKMRFARNAIKGVLQESSEGTQ